MRSLAWHIVTVRKNCDTMCVWGIMWCSVLWEWIDSFYVCYWQSYTSPPHQHQKLGFLKTLITQHIWYSINNQLIKYSKIVSHPYSWHHKKNSIHVNICLSWGLLKSAGLELYPDQMKDLRLDTTARIPNAEFTLHDFQSSPIAALFILQDCEPPTAPDI